MLGKERLIAGRHRPANGHSGNTGSLCIRQNPLKSTGLNSLGAGTLSATPLWIERESMQWVVRT